MFADFRAGSLPRPVDGRVAGPLEWGLSPAWPAALMAAVLYGSLIPFDINVGAFVTSNGFGLLNIGLVAGPPEDLLTNLAVYIPIGVALALCGRVPRKKRLARIPFTVAVGAVVSILAETVQTGISARVASWLDVALNVVGATGGAILGAGLSGSAISAAGRFHAALANQPFTTVAWFLTFGLLLYGLAPFDFVTNTAALHAAFLGVDWSLLKPCPLAPGEPALAELIGKLGAAAWFALLGCAWALAGREAGHRPVIALASAGKQGVVLVSLIELMQLFTRSHRLELAAVVIGTLAVMFGALYAILVIDLPTRSVWKHRPGLAMPSLLLVILVVFQVGLLLAGSMDRYPDTEQPLSLARIQWIPFEALRHRPTLIAAHQIGATLLTYATLTITIAVLLRRVRFDSAWPAAGVTVTLLAFGLEAFQSLTATRIADPTNPALAALAAILVAQVYPALRAAASCRGRDSLGDYGNGAAKRGDATFAASAPRGRRRYMSANK